MKKRTLLSLAILFTVLLSGEKVSAAELITNGGFESATPFLGWVVSNSPNPWRSLQNTVPGQGGGFTSVAPTSVAPGGGLTRNAWNGMTDNITTNSTWSLYQQVIIPAGNWVTVTWSDRYQINHTEFCPGGTCQPKRYFVEITNTSGVVLQTLHTQNTIGNVNQDTGWVARSMLVAGLGGQTVRLRFRGTETTPLTGPGQVEIDMVSMNAFISPNSASVSVGGRVVTADGTGIRNVVVSMVDSGGNTRRVLTSSMGYYRFDDVESGQTVVLSVASKRFVFANPTRVILVSDNIENPDFVADD